MVKERLPVTRYIYYTPRNMFRYSENSAERFLRQQKESLARFLRNGIVSLRKSRAISLRCHCALSVYDNSRMYVFYLFIFFFINHKSFFSLIFPESSAGHLFTLNDKQITASFYNKIIRVIKKKKKNGIQKRFRIRRIDVLCNLFFFFFFNPKLSVSIDNSMSSKLDQISRLQESVTNSRTNCFEKWCEVIISRLNFVVIFLFWCEIILINNLILRTSKRNTNVSTSFNIFLSTVRCVNTHRLQIYFLTFIPKLQSSPCLQIKYPNHKI